MHEPSQASALRKYLTWTHLYRHRYGRNHLPVADIGPKRQSADSRCRRHRRAAPVRPTGRALLRGLNSL